MDESTGFGPEDDRYHELPDDHWQTETNWWSLNVPERRIGLWLHAARHPARGTVDWRVFAWDPAGADPGRLLYYRKAAAVPLPDDADLRDIRFPAGGYGVRMLEPLTSYELTYSDPEARFGLDVRFDGVHPPRRFPPGVAPMFDNVHLDQLGRITGELTVRGERIAVDCHSVRDRTWGPRKGHHSHGDASAAPREHAVRNPGGPLWREIERQGGRGRIQYVFGHVDGSTGFLGFLRVPHGDVSGWTPMTVGWLLRDGGLRPLDGAASRALVLRDPVTGWTSHILLDLRDADGRRMEAEGHAVSWMCENQTGANALLRWDVDGRVAWGEDQDGWRPAHWRAMLDALRAHTR
ncbi:DUF7065 domain-containing protein [Microbacterium sp. No. 7]|uniref:DUF7065 domain-containing protein n=1 Tax=Microbacterium sp. No. 7 TaxID=1714373 RepID=UPI0006ED239D|nr:hypothetical protein [Microbacterium sp. No. 7]ALJ18839.1 hypothetical protein AOA12_02500 [Microbacterium sp. No. 7]